MEYDKIPPLFTDKKTERDESNEVREPRVREGGVTLPEIDKYRKNQILIHNNIWVIKSERSSIMKTIISMRYNEKSDMPSMYSERYGITYSEVRREDEWVYIDIPIDEYIADDNSIIQKK